MRFTLSCLKDHLNITASVDEITYAPTVLAPHKFNQTCK